MNELDPSAWLGSIAEIFESLEVVWTLVGALAANHYRQHLGLSLSCANTALWTGA